VRSSLPLWRFTRDSEEFAINPKPIQVIRPPRKDLAIDFAELVGYRDLLYFLVRRDILVRYKQAILGGTWAILQPLAGMVVLVVFFGRLAHMPSEGVPYPLFTYSGLTLWTFFSQALSESSNSLVSNVNLVTKVYVPRLLIPAAPVVAAFLDLLIASSMLIPILWWYGVGISTRVCLLPLIVGLAGLTAWGAGIGLSALNVKYRDFRYALPFLINLLFLASPVAYPGSLVPWPWRLAYALNPMVGVLDGARWAVFDTKTVIWPVLLVGYISATCLFIASVKYFRRTERFFADMI
jgi:homopolymeric O-antigen transport system permease protein